MENRYSGMIQRLLHYREHLSLTQEQVSKMLDVSQSNYSKMELGKIYLSGQTLGKMYALGWDIDYIMTGEYVEPSKIDIEKELEVDKNKDNSALFSLFYWAVCNRVGKGEISNRAIGELKLLNMLNQLYRHQTVMYCARKVMNMSQFDMAEKIVVCIKNYREMEKGTRIPDGLQLLDICEMTQLRPSLFLEQKDVRWNIMNYIVSSIEEHARDEILNFVKIGMSLIRNKQ